MFKYREKKNSAKKKKWTHRFKIPIPVKGGGESCFSEQVSPTSSLGASRGLGRRPGNMALALHKSDTAHVSSSEGKRYLRKTQRPRVVTSRCPVRRGRMTTAKDRFNEMEGKERASERARRRERKKLPAGRSRGNKRKGAEVFGNR